MAEQQLLQLNQEAVELRRQIDVAYDEWKATTDPDTKKTFERQFTRLVDKEGELEARRKALETRIEANLTITPFELLSRGLPAVHITPGGACTSEKPRHDYRPNAVKQWLLVEQDGTQTLKDAIIRHQDAADNTRSCVRNLPKEEPMPADSEAQVATMLAQHVAVPLMQYSQFAAASGVNGIPMSVTWHQLPPSWIIQRGLQGLHQFDSLPQSVVLEPSCDGHAEGPSKASSSPPTSLSGSKRSREKSDFLAAVETDSSAGIPQPAPTAATAAATAPAAGATTEKRPAKKQRSILVGEVKIAGKLMDGKQPKDLVELWEQEQQPVQAVIAQLFTYMQLHQVCYSFLSCWFATWLAYCPPKDRGTLYLSEPVLAETKHVCGTAPAVTTRGAISWLQQQAIRNINAVLDPLPPPADGDLSNEDNDRRGPSDSAQRESSSKHGMKPPTNKQRGVGGQDMSKRHASVQLHGELCTGSAGLVTHGLCNGKPAVIKMYGPDDPGLATYRQELHVYKQLAVVQGRLVPELLGYGHLKAGVYFLATQYIQSEPLSAMANITPAIAKAALHALQQLQHARPGFLHGDIRLANVLLVGSAAGGDVDMKCMMIDFGQSKLNATRKDMQRELKQLKQVLGS